MEDSNDDDGERLPLVSPARNQGPVDEENEMATADISCKI